MKVYYDFSFIYDENDKLNVSVRAYAKQSLSEKYDIFLIDVASQFFKKYSNITINFCRNTSEIESSIYENRDAEFVIAGILFEQKQLIYKFLDMLNRDYKFLYCDELDIHKKYYSIYSIYNTSVETMSAIMMMYGVIDITLDDAKVFHDKVKYFLRDTPSVKRIELIHDTELRYTNQHVAVVKISSFDTNNHDIIWELLDYLEQHNHYLTHSY